MHIYSPSEQHAAAHDAGGAEQQRRRPVAAGFLPDIWLLLRSPRALPVAPRLRGRSCSGTVCYVLCTILKVALSAFLADGRQCCFGRCHSTLVTGAHPFQEPIGGLLHSPKSGSRFR